MDITLNQEITEYGTRRLLHLKNTGDTERPEIKIFFDILDEYAIPETALCDGYIFGIIFYAMARGEDIHVHGTLSADCMRNLNEFQDAWTRWKPERYKKIAITASHIDPMNPGKPNSAIAAFSGGIDSLFTILRHKKILDTASYPLGSTVLMVHGFDIPLDKPSHLEALKERTTPFINELDLTIRVIRTNLKELALQDWEDSFMAQLACCMHQYSHQCNYALVGSSEPYDSLVLPWGSNPVTDHLLSGAAMRIIHDGAGYSRTEKVAEIINHKAAMKVAKVCWEGAETFTNCGNCEKCIRTQLNFKAAGVNHPPCFEQPLDCNKIKTIPIVNEPQLAELASILRYAKERNLHGDWVTELEKRVKIGICYQSRLRQAVAWVVRLR